MRMTPPAIAALLALISSGIPSVFAMEQPAPAVAAAASPYSYADLADLAVAAPMAIHVKRWPNRLICRRSGVVSC